jgi:hypothetical protein
MNEQERRGYELFEKWVLANGMTFERCKHSGVGYDYTVIDKNGKRGSYEVKGSKHIRAIPNLFLTEVDEKTHMLKADFLFVTGNILAKDIVQYRIPRKAFKPENFRQRQTWHVARFQNKNMDQYRV